MTWFLLAILGSFSSAAMSLGQQILKADTIPMLVWLRAVSLIVMIGILPFFSWPTAPSFYIGAVLFGILIVFLDVTNFKYIAECGAAVATRLSTMSSIPAFFLWVAIDQQTQILYWNNPLNTAAIIGVVLCAVYFATRLRHCTVTMNAVKRLWILIFYATIAGVFTKKIILSNPDPIGAIVIYIMIICAISVFMLTVYMIKNRPNYCADLLNIKNIQAGTILSISSLVMIFSSYISMSYITNPIYVSIIFMTVPVMISLYNRLTGYPDDSNKWAGFGIVACAMVLAVVKV